MTSRPQTLQLMENEAYPTRRSSIEVVDTFKNINNMMEMAEYVSKIYGQKMENIKVEMDNMKKLYDNLPIEEPLNEPLPKEAKTTKSEKVFQPTMIQNEIPDVDLE